MPFTLFFFAASVAVHRRVILRIGTFLHQRFERIGVFTPFLSRQRIWLQQGVQVLCQLCFALLDGGLDKV